MFWRKKEQRIEKKKSLAREAVEIVVAIAVAILVYYGLSFVLGTPMPIVSVVSGSMEPVLYRGDLIILTSPKDIKVTDVVIYQRPDISETIIHRIIEERDGGYIIKGDNNPIPDPGIVRRNQIIGKVIYAVPLLGYPRVLVFELELLARGNRR